MPGLLRPWTHSSCGCPHKTCTKKGQHSTMKQEGILKGPPVIEVLWRCWCLLGKEESEFLLKLWLLVRLPSSGRWPFPQKYWESTSWSQWVMKTNKQKDSTREMAQQLRVCTAFVEDPSSNPSIHNRKLFIIINSSYRGSNILFWPSWTPADTCKRPLVHI